MNLGNIIKNAAGRYAGRTGGTTSRAPGTGRYGTSAGRTAGGSGVTGEISRRIKGMLKRR